MTPKRISIVTSGHLTTCPRLVKAARALAAEGYQVRIVSATLMDHFRRMDAELVGRERWEWDPIEWSAGREWLRYVSTGLRHRVAQQVVASVGSHRVPSAVNAAAFHRLHAELARRAAEKPADLYYGGGGGATAAVSEAAARTGAAFGVDLEDFHTGQSIVPDTRGEIVERVEEEVLGRAAFLTAGSPAIAGAYRAKYRLDAIAVCNTFPLPATAPLPPNRARDRALRLYWFSQTIGPERGLETVIDALGHADVTAELHLRGAADDGYVAGLRAAIASQAPRLALVLHDVDASDQMTELCRPYDIGLAVEPGGSPNNALSLSNKALTYPLAGLALVLTDTPGHRPLIDDMDGEAVVFKPGDVDTLARGLRRWHNDRGALADASAASWRAATRRWHWEGHDREALVAAAFGALH